MNATLGAMITAVVGVLGTLFAPVLAQRGDDRRRRAEAAETERLRRFGERREAYTAMNRASRQFHTLLKDALHRIRDGVYTAEERDLVEESRRDYRDRYAEAQMIVPERVLAASRDVNRVLAAADAAAKRLDRGLAADGESPRTALEALRDAEPLLRTMQRLMREDLGVTD
ncbi:hypothetical protein OG539_26275 [Actinacidiphila glaucinigra]|uniref:hypothetical protein n=1 Tax=Actinacidiphila glaucinigra TaxID=235986 RepID=UPI002DD84433|nr:hypothetical protein [Actinacidiphila glaucinigra]WSD60429.1 hypothetical protein OIE69_16630 [Actinacidiphila glaucinigra]